MTTDQWQNRREIKSSSSGRIYTVAQRISTGLYECSCPGWKSRRNCKHLREMGLPTIGSQGLTGVSRARPKTPSAAKAAANFADTKKHYDPSREGYGNAAEWRKQAESIIAGKGALKVPSATASPTTRPYMSPNMAADMAALGIKSLPADADGLLVAMQARAEILDDPISGNQDEFWKMFAAFERLSSYYQSRTV